MIRFFSTLLFPLIFASGCVKHAAPIPMITFGGPTTINPKQSEVGMGVGSGAELFPGAHFGGSGWYGNWRYGFSKRMDAGIDVLGLQRQDKGALLGKVTLRYRLGDEARFDIGLGATDDSDGKSVGGEMGIVLGTQKPTSWNYYSSLRTIGALSITENEESPSALYLVGALGGSGRVSEHTQVIIEGGAGPVFVKDNPDVGLGMYLGVGMKSTINADR